MTERRRLILHVGLPKTGTSALQRWCDDNRAALRRQGVDYPECRDDAITPKHQFIVGDLQGNSLQRLEELLDETSAQTVVLSSEGLTNHLYDFRPHMLQLFREATKAFDLTVFLVVRERGAWTKSYYKQAVLNPPVIPGFHWGTSLDYTAFRALPRVQRLTSHPRLQEDLQAAFGAADVVAAAYEGDWMARFTALLDIDGAAAMRPLERTNVSLSDDLIELIRQINGMGVSADERAYFLTLIRDCFATSHNMLLHFRRRGPGDDHMSPRAVEMAKKLTGRTPGQSELIESLRGFLASRALSGGRLP